ncbi:hypothetical protein CBR_g22871 [Chara braunii]|uniref:Uncharacterized protein n=1 Tax=Chara braunii TaxID=69332 RepID=A0A388L2X2_CHABU|nr:hypothetical protein CBR_g22871 [Chara braunii]|eukprot:GBG76655.1 hypothetical protein CBR_g22871 [Chara braunii]
MEPPRVLVVPARISTPLQPTKPRPQDIARFLIKVALQRAAKKQKVTYPEMVKTPRGLRREFHDDITCIVFFFNHYSSLQPLATKAQFGPYWQAIRNVSWLGRSNSSGPSIHSGQLPISEEELSCPVAFQTTDYIETVGLRSHMFTGGVLDTHHGIEQGVVSPSFSLTAPTAGCVIQQNVFGSHVEACSVGGGIPTTQMFIRGRFGGAVIGGGAGNGVLGVGAPGLGVGLPEGAGMEMAMGVGPEAGGLMRKNSRSQHACFEGCEKVEDIQADSNPVNHED